MQAFAILISCERSSLFFFSHFTELIDSFFGHIGVDLCSSLASRRYYGATKGRGATEVVRDYRMRSGRRHVNRHDNGLHRRVSLFPD